MTNSGRLSFIFLTICAMQSTHDHLSFHDSCCMSMPVTPNESANPSRDSTALSDQASHEMEGLVQRHLWIPPPSENE
eukprot:CAMPEP_0184354594 /NCGR_PEP_ID=MMETSP1089-20130417/89446_1 /TAXON_ID=38269 ORGANISM="Gloeochaete wittrockiana, Strain SAG46.84" /NCGR_SAMPLE_ID=MMETSP1089 /ASSEMBLY_ACC=CAM_ASM_000445 /LENGTH=76 /DNA_ID=CAMNT_0026690681 /DNA_START=349 /DNA_END=579 /DNA_ORIENTATION=-